MNTLEILAKLLCDWRVTLAYYDEWHYATLERHGERTVIYRDRKLETVIALAYGGAEPWARE